jgi:predicted cupin superfamily sugar epimerase
MENTAATAKALIAKLQLERHPEGGWYKETWRADAKEDERASGTAIYYLLEADQFSHWHKVDATEIWHWYAGAPLSLSISANGHDVESLFLGPDVLNGHKPQQIVPAGHWQCATSLGHYTLVGCTVSPGFQFSGFELADPNWRPTPRKC